MSGARERRYVAIVNFAIYVKFMMRNWEIVQLQTNKLEVNFILARGNANYRYECASKVAPGGREML